MCSDLLQLFCFCNKKIEEKRLDREEINAAIEKAFKKAVINNPCIWRFDSSHIVFHKVTIFRKRIPAFFYPSIGQIAGGYIIALVFQKSLLIHHILPF